MIEVKKKSCKPATSQNHDDCISLRFSYDGTMMTCLECYAYTFTRYFNILLHIYKLSGWCNKDTHLRSDNMQFARLLSHREIIYLTKNLRSGQNIKVSRYDNQLLWLSLTQYRNILHLLVETFTQLKDVFSPTTFSPAASHLQTWRCEFFQLTFLISFHKYVNLLRLYL